MKKLALSIAALLMSGIVMAKSSIADPVASCKNTTGPCIDKSYDKDKNLIARLYFDGEPYFVRGMIYAPEPRGLATDPKDPPNMPPPRPVVNPDYVGNWLSKNSKDQYNWYRYVGAWMCGPINQYAPNDWKSACWDDDLTGTLTPGVGRNDDYNKLIINKWKTDLDDMKKLGINTIRLYNVNPTGKNHLKFLEMANERKIHVIYPAMTHYMAVEFGKDPLLPPKEREAKISEMIKTLVNETCPSGKLNPAILAYMAGNEMIPLSKDDPKEAAWELAQINNAVSIVKAQCPKALVTYAHNDFPDEWELRPIGDKNGTSALMQAIPGVDFMTINSYRNAQDGGILGYGPLFKSMKEVKDKYKKPILIGEVGEWQNMNFEPNWYNRSWGFIVQNALVSGNLGAMYFEYNDEPIKKYSNDPQLRSNDAFMGIVTANWPSAADKDKLVDVPNIPKTKNYNGIPVFKDTDGTVVDFGDKSKKGAGRYEMFSNDGKGIGACNYVYSPDPEHVSTECLNASKSSVK